MKQEDMVLQSSTVSSLSVCVVIDHLPGQQPRKHVTFSQGKKESIDEPFLKWFAREILLARRIAVKSFLVLVILGLFAVAPASGAEQTPGKTTVKGRNDVVGRSLGVVGAGAVNRALAPKKEIDKQKVK